MRHTALLLLLSGCSDIGPPRIDGPLQLGGDLIAADTLQRGRASYVRYCQSCHGPQGDGLGPLGLHQQPPARDLRLGIIKYASVPAGGLPTDDDLRRIIRGGLAGTAMLPWRVDDAELEGVVQYTKVFSTRWQRERAGEPIALSADPWSDVEAARKKGEIAYHASGCARCHPATLSEPALRELASQRGLDPETFVRPNSNASVIGESSLGALKATDFRLDPLRNGHSPEDLYRVIAAGVGGTSMPTWKGAIPNDELWAVVHYVRSLVP